MPFKSKAQMRYLYAKHPNVAKEFAAATPKGTELPDHVKEKPSLLDQLKEKARKLKPIGA